MLPGAFRNATTAGAGAKAWGEEEQQVRERLASFLGTLFVKQEIQPADVKVLAHVATQNPSLHNAGRKRGGCSSAQLLAVAAGSGSLASPPFLELLSRLLDGETLDRKDATSLGRRGPSSDCVAPFCQPIHGLIAKAHPA